MKHNFSRVAMLSTHGYFDPKPKLGQTDTGGQVVYVLELAKAISKSGTKVDIFTRWFDKGKPQIEEVPGYPGVRVIRIPAGPWEFIPKEHIYDVLPELSKNMIKFIDEKGLDYDLYHGHYVDAGIVTLDVAGIKHAPSFFTAHSLGAWKKDQMGGDPEVMEEKFNFNHRISEEIRIFEQVNAQTLTSKVQREKLKELYDFDADNIEIIPPGVNIHVFRQPENEESAPKELPDKYIYCLSRIDTNKGHDMLLDAFHLLSREIPDVSLVIGGGSPDPKPREKEVFDMIRRMVHAFGIEDRVKLIGYVPDDSMVPYYQHSLFFVLPSLFEPFGMTSQEAMACGKPVVASKYGGIRNIIDDGKTGILVDPKNSKEFADAMKKLVQHDTLRTEIGNRACQMIRTEFSWEMMAERHFDLYDRFMD